MFGEAVICILKSFWILLLVSIFFHIFWYHYLILLFAEEQNLWPSFSKLIENIIHILTGFGYDFLSPAVFLTRIFLEFSSCLLQFPSQNADWNCRFSMGQRSLILPLGQPPDNFTLIRQREKILYIYKAQRENTNTKFWEGFFHLQIKHQT